MIEPIFFIAEIGVNHNGSIELAKRMIDAAKQSGADAVKFQTFTAKTLVSPGTPKVRYQERTTLGEESHYEMIQKLELKRKDHFLLKSYCEDLGVQFLSTPYDIDSAKFLHEELDVPMFKTASADIVDLPLHEYIASTGKHSIVSVGMATLGEIEDVINVYKKLGRQDVTLLHCVSNYPCDDQSLNLNVLKTLKSAFQLPVGFSDHSVGHVAAVLSAAFGVRIIEKHFTLDKTLPGPDHSASSTPQEFAELKIAVTRAMNMLGSSVKQCQEEEMQMAMVSRKSITLKCDLRTGEKIERHHLVMRRPGTGLMAKDVDRICGLRARVDLRAGHQINYSDLN